MDRRIEAKLNETGHAMRLLSQAALEGAAVRIRHDLKHGTVDEILADMDKRIKEDGRALREMKDLTKLMELNVRECEGEDIDSIMQLGCAFPMGPLRLADYIGLDVCRDIMLVMYHGLDENPTYLPSDKLVELFKIS